MGRAADDHERGRELPRLRRRRDGARDDGRLPPPGGAFRRRVRHRRRHPGRLLGAALPGLGRRRRVPGAHGDRGDRRLRAVARARIRAATAGPRRLGLRDVRRRLLPRQGDRGRRRRRLGDGGGALPDALRHEGHDRPPPERVPRVADHARPRPGEREDRVRDERARRRSARRGKRRERAAPFEPSPTRPGRSPRRASSSRSATIRTRSSSSTSSTTTRTATS